MIWQMIWTKGGENVLTVAMCRLHKLQVKHAQRQEVAQRAQRATTEELAWDDDDAPFPSAPLKPLFAHMRSIKFHPMGKTLSGALDATRLVPGLLGSALGCLNQQQCITCGHTLQLYPDTMATQLPGLSWSLRQLLRGRRPMACLRHVHDIVCTRLQ